MKKRLAVLLLALVLLCGCAQRPVRQVVPDMPSAGDPAPTPSPTPQPSPVPQDVQRYGSVRLPGDPTVLVSVYLNDAAHRQHLDREARARAQQSVAMAVDWLTRQAAGYGVDARIYYDDGTDTSRCATPIR